jgi:hypothetical protein
MPTLKQTPPPRPQADGAVSPIPRSNPTPMPTRKGACGPDDGRPPQHPPLPPEAGPPVLPPETAGWSDRQLMDLASRREHETDGLAQAAVDELRRRGLDGERLRALAIRCVRHRIRRTHVLSVAEPDPHLRLPRNPLLSRAEIVRLFEEEEARVSGPVDDPLYDGLDAFGGPPGGGLPAEDDGLDEDPFG